MARHLIAVWRRASARDCGGKSVDARGLVRSGGGLNPLREAECATPLKQDAVAHRSNGGLVVLAEKTTERNTQLPQTLQSQSRREKRIRLPAFTCSTAPRN